MSVRYLLLVLVVAVLASACGQTTNRGAEPERAGSIATRTACPSQVLYRASALAPIRTVLNAAERQLSRQRTQTQGTWYRLTPRNAPIVHVEQLAVGQMALDESTPGLLRVHRVAAKQCGERLAQASWAIHYDTPVAAIAGPGAFRFFVKTRRGWRFWGTWCGAGHSKGWRLRYCI